MQNFSNETPQKNDIKNFELLYSPRTEYSNLLEYEETLFNDLTLNFDPITIKIIKKHFKERLGSLNKDEFISILKNHLLSWHQELPNRETMLIKLLGRLFSEIDLNDNGSMEWAEFTNYIIHNSNGTNKQNNTNNPAYRLRFYYPVKNKLDINDNKEVISHAFYIEKHNMLGIVQEGKSVIYFYEANTFKKMKTIIDLRDIQREIDDLEIKELDMRSEEMLKREMKEKEEKMKMQRTSRKIAFEPSVTNYKLTRLYDKPWLTKTTMANTERMTMTMPAFNTITKKRRLRNDEVTPEKLKKELEKIKHEQILTQVNKKLTVVSTVFINEFDVLLVSTTNNKICAWQYLNGEFKNVNGHRDFRIEKNYFKCSILSSDNPQNAMVWDPVQRFLFTGQPDGKILKWDLAKSKPLEREELEYSKAKKKKEEELHKNKNLDKDDQILERKFLEKKKLGGGVKIPGRENIIVVKEKRDSVSCIILLGKLQLLAASYYNGHIILWDPLLKDFRKYYFDQETGVYSMSYDSSKNLLITAGFNHDIFIYDPYIDNSSIYKLTGHNWSINSIVANEKDAEIISMDILGNIKIWDSQNFLNFQTINLNETIEVKKSPNENLKTQKLSSNLKMIYMQKIKKILIFGSKLMLFETDRSLNPDLADDQIILACYYEKITKTIISFCLRKIKMWNIFTGKLKKVYEDPMNNEITAYAIDKNTKRAFLGDNTGRIKNFNMKNGKLLKELESHSGEINMLVHSLSLNIVISCSVDNIIKIHDDTELTESEVKKELVIGTNQVKAICICEKFARLAIGLSSGAIRFYDIAHFRYDSDLRNDSDKKEGNDEVTCLAALEDVEIIFSGHASGKCRFLVGPPSAMKFYEIVSFSNNDINDKAHKTSASCAEFDFANKLMFIGDQIGKLKCYDLTELFDMIELGRSKTRSENDPLITLEVVQAFKEVRIPLKWSVDAHKESIKHLHYVDIEPRIVISTSNDLKIKIFSAETGKYKDELKQIACKYKPVPIGIKYHVSDPFKGRNEQVEEEHIVMRKDLVGLNLQNIDEIENQQISEYSKKITEYNAKEKLWSHVKGSKLKETQSNNWDLDINVEKVKEKEEEELKEVIDVVRQKEKLIQQTEMIMQQKSIYSDSYKPQFVSEMDEGQLQDFSNLLSQKLRQVKLAISKANLSQNKFSAFENERKKKEQMSKELHEMINQRISTNVVKKKKLKPIISPPPEQTEIGETKETDPLQLVSALAQSSQIDPLHRKTKTRFIKPIDQPIELRPIKSVYAFERNKLITAEDNFKKCNEDCDNGYNEALRACEMLAKKAKIVPKSKKKKDKIFLRIMTDDPE